MIDHFQFSSLIEYCVAKSSLELRSKKLFRVGNLSKLLFSDLIFNLDEKGCLTRRQGGREGFFLLFFIEIWFITCSSSSQWFWCFWFVEKWIKTQRIKKFFKGEKEKWSCFQVQNMPVNKKIIMNKKKSCYFSCSDGFHNGEKCRQPASTSSSLELTNKAL